MSDRSDDANGHDDAPDSELPSEELPDSEPEPALPPGQNPRGQRRRSRNRIKVARRLPPYRGRAPLPEEGERGDDD